MKKLLVILIAAVIGCAGGTNIPSPAGSGGGSAGIGGSGGAPTVSVVCNRETKWCDEWPECRGYCMPAICRATHVPDVCYPPYPPG